MKVIKYDEEREYKLISPQGDLYLIHNLHGFSKEFNLFHSNLFELVKGKRKSVKGWTLFKEEEVS